MANKKNKQTSLSFFKEIVTRFPANYFLLLSILSLFMDCLAIRSYFHYAPCQEEAICGIFANIVRSSIIFYSMTSGVFLLWSLSLRKHCLRDMLNKQVSLPKRIFIVFSLFALIFVTSYLLFLIVTWVLIQIATFKIIRRTPRSGSCIQVFS